MKSSFIRKSIGLALGLVFIFSSLSFAVAPGILIQHIVKLQSAKTDQLLPLVLLTEQHTIRYSGSESKKWTYDILTIADGNKGVVAWKRPQFRAQYITPEITFDVWGAGRDIGAPQADAGELIILGSLGTRPLAWGGMANAVAIDHAKVRSSFKVAGANVSAAVHQLGITAATARTNLEVYADYKLDAATIGGIARLGYDADPDDNTHTLVGFVSSKLGGVNVGGSAGARFGKSVNGDNLGFAVKADTKLQDGALVLEGQIVNRQKNFYEPKSQDAAFQIGLDRFRNTSSGNATVEGSLIRFVGTWLGEANKARPALSVLHSTSEATLTNMKGPAFQGIFQISKDGSPEAQTMLVARAGTRFLENNFWAVGELKITKDNDGVGSIDGVAGKDTRTDIRGRVRYNLKDAGLGDWFALGIFEAASTKDAADKVGSTNKFGGEIWYDIGKLRIIGGYTSEGRKSWTKRSNLLYTQFQLKY